MIINIKYRGMPFNESLTDNIIRKLEELSENYEIITKAEILIQRKNTTEFNGAYCKIKLYHHYSWILSETRTENLNTAIEKTIGKLKIELLKIELQSISKSAYKIKKRLFESE